MLELVIAACLYDAEPCRDFSILYDPREVTMTMCATRGQIEVARWKADHVDWTIRRWSCSYVPRGVAEL